jgi:hypothetical protein
MSKRQRDEDLRDRVIRLEAELDALQSRMEERFIKWRDVCIGAAIPILLLLLQLGR